MAKLNIAAKRRARRFVLQALYQWYFNPGAPEESLRKFLTKHPTASVDTDFFQQLLLGIKTEYNQLDASMVALLEHSLSTIQPIEQAILRIGAYELKHCSETPPRVVINEAIELAKAFGAPGAHKYVNGILHELVSQYRPEGVEKE